MARENFEPKIMKRSAPFLENIEYRELSSFIYSGPYPLHFFIYLAWGGRMDRFLACFTRSPSEDYKPGCKHSFGVLSDLWQSPQYDGDDSN